MGYFADGVWQEKDIRDEQGRFVRLPSPFRHWVTKDGSPGPTGEGGFKAEPGRYHLYVSLGCPWAHRTVIFRKLKKLDGAISLTVVDPERGERGWLFTGNSGSDLDTLNGKNELAEIYLAADPRFTGRITVPVLWDKLRKTIVNNESSDIIRMLNSAFDAFTGEKQDFYPEERRAEIDEINASVYRNVNNGVYRAGFAGAQQPYEEAYRDIFSTLDQLDERLGNSRYLVGGKATEADWRLFPTLARFDTVYYSHFKCNRQRIADYPNLSHYLRDLYQTPGVAETVNFQHIKLGYYRNQRLVNPTGIVALGPDLDLNVPHDRGRFGAN
jgi:putative glutathione S-transferase